MRRFLVAVVVLVAGFVISCTKEDTDNAVDIVESATAPYWYVIDEQSETLTRINTHTWEVEKNIVYLGQAANDIEIDRANDWAFVVSSLDNRLFKIDLSSGSIDVYKFPAGSNPYNLCLDETNVYVTLSVSNQVVVIEKSTMATVTQFAISGVNYIEGIKRRGNYLYVLDTGYKGAFTYTNGTLYVYKIPDFSLYKTVGLGTNSQSLDIDTSDGEIYVVCTGDYGSVKGEVWVIKESDFTVKTNLFVGGSPSYIGIGPWHIAFITGDWNGGVFVINVSSESVVHSSTNALLDGYNLKGVAFYEDNAYISGAYGATNAFVVDTLMLDVVKTLSGIGGGDCALNY